MSASRDERVTGSLAVAARPLTSVTLLALGVNGIVGAGIFFAPPAVARAFPGSIGALAYLAVALACVPIALAYARLARAMPEDGGPALYAARAFGPRATVAIGTLTWISAVFSASAVTRALAERVAHGRVIAVVVVVACIALGTINARGLKPSAWTWTVLTVAKLSPLLLLALLGLLTTSGPVPSVIGSELGRETGTAHGKALLAILFALQGFEIVALPAGQARDAARTVPRATVAALVVAALLYALVHLACTRALPDLATVQAAIPATAAKLAGPSLSRALELGELASIAGIVVGMHAMTPRYLAAIRASLTAPLEEGGEARTEEAPRGAILVSGIAVALLGSFGSLGQLIELSSVAVLAQYAVSAAALFVLSRARRHGLTPVDAWPVPLVFAVTIILLLQAPLKEIAFAGIVAMFGALISSRVTPRASPGRGSGPPSGPSSGCGGGGD